MGDGGERVGGAQLAEGARAWPALHPRQMHAQALTVAVLTGAALARRRRHPHSPSRLQQVAAAPRRRAARPLDLAAVAAYHVRQRREDKGVRLTVLYSCCSLAAVFAVLAQPLDGGS